MKLKHYPDVSSIRQTEEVELIAGVTVPIQDLPPAYADELASLLPEPEPPKVGPLRDRKGRIERDEQGRPMIEYNFADPEYRRALARHATRSTVFFIMRGVVDGHLEFDAELNGDFGEYCDAVLAEMKEFGLGMGQANRIAVAVRNLSGITAEDVERAERGFSSPDTD